MLTLCLAILSAHFARVFAGNVYRACPAFVMSREQLAQMLGKQTTTSSMVIKDDGSCVESSETVLDVDAITPFERLRFFAHCLLAS